MKRIASVLLILLLLLSGCAALTGTENAAPEVSLETVTPETSPEIVAPEVSSEPVAEQNGREVRVAIIDTGISSAAIGAQHLAQGANYLIPENGTEDTYGHGTAVASVILEHSENVVLVPLVSNVYSKGKISFVDNDTYAQMIRDAVDVYHCDIINISAGLVLDKKAIREAIAYAEEKGVLVVASAGNDYVENPGQIYYPAAYETVLAVGALDKEGTGPAAFAQRGPWVDCFAPGEEITVRTISGGKSTGQGSSYAAARVTAAAANCLQKNEMPPAKIRLHLLENPSVFDGLANESRS